MRYRIVPALCAWLLASCGSAPTPAATAEEALRTAQVGTLDWALLLPIETEGLVWVDLSRMRRSPHHASLRPMVDELLGEVGDPRMRQGLSALVDRTDVVLIAMLPSHHLEPGGGEQEDVEVLILARGSYRSDEVEQLDALDPGHTQRLELRGQPVWVGSEGDDRTSMTQLTSDTLVVTESVERMERLLARVGMRGRSPRWPPAVRGLVEASGLEEATFGLALANRSFGDGGEDEIPMSVAGRADVDGPLDVEVFVELGDASLATAAAVFLEGFVREIARSAEGESFALRGVAERVQIEARGTRIRGSLHAERADADQLIPGLMGLLRDGLGEAPMPSLDDNSMPIPL
jgi:hypothetical protein